ncbi:MAG: hypothetical protein HZC28_04195 [Spirochaetes bacterium]|nr:hypothetical protein [Spirochaetota bacterium]
MNVTFLGTGAGEGYPGLFCECPNCTYARVHGGRNIRTNTATLIDADTMLDMNDTCFVTAARMGIPLGRVRHLLITHSDDDHLSSQMLWWRFMTPGLDTMPKAEQMKISSPRFTAVPDLHVFGSRATKHALMRVRPEIFDTPSRQQIIYHQIEDGKSYQEGGLTIRAIRAQHGAPGFCHNYIVERGGKTLLYASDTGGYDDDMMKILFEYRYDLVIMEGTYGLGYNGPGHMCLEKNRAFRKLLADHGCFADNARMVITHMSPHWTPPHDEYAAMLSDEGIDVAYDGLRI